VSKSRIAKNIGLSRRSLLRGMGGCAAMSQVPVLSTVLNLSLTNAAAAAIDTTGYKALVCVFLHGGIDSFNMLAPTDDGGPYDDYVLARGALALEREDPVTLPPNPMLPIVDAAGAPGMTNYGLHPGLAGVRDLYNAGNLAFVANLGSLVEPMDLSTYYTGRRPLGLYSHSDLQRHWQTATPQSRTQITGWAGRMADVLDPLTNENPAIPMNIAVDYMNIFQTGDTLTPYVVDDRNGAEEFTANKYSNAMDLIMSDATDSFLSQTYSNLLKRTMADVSFQAIEAAENYNAMTESVFPDPEDPLAPQFVKTLANDTGHLGRQLLQVAKAIGAHTGLLQNRQVFFVEAHGWDHHASLLTNQGNMLPAVGNALKAFYEATEYLNEHNNVVAFTASDFARTLNGNANIGSDHAWGGNYIVMGGAVQGGQIFGTYPDSLAPGNPLDVGRGRLIPTTSVDEYNATMALWFGMENDGVLETMLPNIRNFYDASETEPPLGFLG
jgi:uncharacterized protein (DUF1501 family)